MKNKKLLALFIAFLLTVMPISTFVFAEPEDENTASDGTIVEDSGEITVGDLAFTINEDGTATVYSCINKEATEIDIPSSVHREPPETIDVPSTWAECPVTAIGSNAFSDIATLEKVTIPDTVKTIGDEAFAYCTALEDITIPDSVTTLGNGIFAYCQGLKKMYLSDNITDMGAGTFAACTSLEDVRLSENVLEFKDSIFAYCLALQTVSLPAATTTLGVQMFAGCASLQSLDLPKGIATIPQNSIAGCSALTEIVIPENVMIIDSYAFESCTALKSVTIPASVVDIGYVPWVGCIALTEINVVNGSEYFSNVDGVLFNADKTELIQYPPGKTDVQYVFPSETTKIAMCAFATADLLESVTIPNEITEIPGYCFMGARLLREINLPDTLTIIGMSSFYSLPELKTLKIPATVTEIPANSVGFIYDEATNTDTQNTELMIIGESGSAAETYALENNFKFEETKKSFFKSDYWKILGMAAIGILLIAGAIIWSIITVKKAKKRYEIAIGADAPKIIDEPEDTERVDKLFKEVNKKAKEDKKDEIDGGTEE